MDVDWEDLTLLVQRAVVAGRVDTVKTKYSRTLPLDPEISASDAVQVRQAIERVLAVEGLEVLRVNHARVRLLAAS